MSTGSIGTPPSSPSSASSTTAAGGFTLDDIRALAQILREFELGDLELARANGERLRLRARQSEVVSTVSMPAPRPAAAPAPTGQQAEPSPAPSKAKEAADPNVTVVAAPLVAGEQQGSDFQPSAAGSSQYLQASETAR